MRNWFASNMKNEIPQEIIKANGEEGKFFSWNYKPGLSLVSTGYEEYYPLFKSCKKG